MLDYTPRRTMTLYTFADMERRNEQRELLTLLTAAGRFEGKDIDKLAKDLED